MGAIKGLAITFSMYSKIPVPIFPWKEEDMRYSMVFFPLVGLIIGGLLTGWWYLSHYFGFGEVFTAAVATLLPLLITGGIHMDGYLDTVDAMSSYKPKEVKLQILKDPHLGAFACIAGSAYFLLYFAAVTECKSLISWLIISSGFILSRALSGLSLVWFPGAKKEGTLHTFSAAAQKNVTVAFLCVTVVLAAILMAATGGFKGVAVTGLALVVFIYYRQMSMKKFGGITGDLAGFFLQVCELAMVLGAAVLF